MARIILAAAASLAGCFAAAANDAVLVLDGSGSMWGQIDGATKIEVARDAIDGLLDQLPAGRRLGLIAYGHNRDADCSDIETLVRVGGSRANIRAAISAINPRGRTPLSDAVEMAAEELRYTEDKATVILVSDGIETCGRDPCAVGAALEAAGVDFTAHVIGFNVVEPAARDQLACLANETGGRFLAAEDADSLAGALEETVVKEPGALASALFILQASELEGGPLIEEGLAWSVRVGGGGPDMFEASGVGQTEAPLPAGVYDISVTRLSDGATASLELEPLAPGEERTVTIPLQLDVAAQLTVFPEGAIAAGSDVLVTWEGPDRAGDYLRLGREVDGRFVGSETSYVSVGNPITLRAPLEPGEYEVAYMLGRPTKMLARASLTVAAVTASLEAPESAPPNTDIAVTWTGPEPGTNDFITIVAPDAPDRAYTNYHYTQRGAPATLRTPLEPGAYELRFVQGGAMVLARRAITVADTEASLEAPASWPANSDITIGWTGPATASDFITIVEPDRGERDYRTYAYARPGETTVSFATPLEAGEYELRYVQGGAKVLARQPITIQGADAALEAAATWPANTPIPIGWTGPATARDFITIVEPDAGDRSYGTYAYPRPGEAAVEFATPLEPGDYELRYVQGGEKVLARQPITVEPVTATLSGPTGVETGAVFAVEFEGPGHSGDFVTIVTPAAGPRAYASYHYAREESPGELTAPDVPGPYELRYVQAGRKVLARQPITVE